ncbi:MAG: hypothetical protein QOE71_3935 [Pseudonocardiales bacterium]|nr:hypothetical protein [Pseudonocardiales bacterium]
MSARRLSAVIDAIAAGRPPGPFRADADDAELLRTAIQLRAARPGESGPTTAFTVGLFQRLSEQLNGREARRPEPMPVRRRRTALVAVAAAAMLVAGTAAVTETVNHAATGRSAARAPQGSEVRTGTFQTSNGKVLGQIVAYRGRPSWVFMNVDVPNYSGPIKCMLQVDNGSTVAFGVFAVRNGIGQFSKTIGSVDVSDLRGAVLATPTGSAVAEATFAG